MTNVASGALEPQPRDVHLRELLLRTKEESSRPELVTVADDGDPVAHVDPELLGHAMHLLVENAIAYAGGAELAATVDGGRFVLRVVDHGPGIPDARKHQVFERFTRGEHSQSGWGLGLSVVEHVAKVTGAEVRLTDNFAMLPASAVSGFYFGHRDSQYFGVARIGEDQLADYAARRGVDLDQATRWLRPNLD